MRKKGRRKKGKVKAKAAGQRKRRSSPPSALPLLEKDVLRRMSKLRAEDKILWDDAKLDKDNKGFMTLAASLKKLMVKKKRL